MGVADVKREGTDVTVVAWMGMLHRSWRLRGAWKRRDLGRGLGSSDVASHGQGNHPGFRSEDAPRRGGGGRGGFAGLGAEIGTIITEECVDYLDFQFVRVTGANAPMPYARNLELAKTPSKDAIMQESNRSWPSSTGC